MLSRNVSRMAQPMNDLHDIVSRVILDHQTLLKEKGHSETVSRMTNHGDSISLPEFSTKRQIELQMFVYRIQIDGQSVKIN